jgi:hypothetical protein
MWKCEEVSELKISHLIYLYHVIYVDTIFYILPLFGSSVGYGLEEISFRFSLTL